MRIRTVNLWTAAVLLNKGSISGEKIKQQRGREGGTGGFNSSSQGKRNNTEMFSVSLSTKL